MPSSMNVRISASENGSSPRPRKRSGGRVIDCGWPGIQVTVLLDRALRFKYQNMPMESAMLLLRERQRKLTTRSKPA